MTSLTRSLPDTYEDMCCWSFLVVMNPDVGVDDEDEGAILPELSKEISDDKLISVSGNKAIMSSNSLTTSNIDGLSSGWS